MTNDTYAGRNELDTAALDKLPRYTADQLNRVIAGGATVLAYGLNVTAALVMPSGFVNLANGSGLIAAVPAARLGEFVTVTA
jgi:hypothetical protein